MFHSDSSNFDLIFLEQFSNICFSELDRVVSNVNLMLSPEKYKNCSLHPKATNNCNLNVISTKPNLHVGEAFQSYSNVVNKNDDRFLLCKKEAKQEKLTSNLSKLFIQESKRNML